MDTIEEEEFPFDDDFEFVKEIDECYKECIETKNLDLFVQSYESDYNDLINLKCYPHHNDIIYIDQTINMLPFEYDTIDENNSDFESALENFINNLFIPSNKKLLLHGVYYFCKKNCHDIISFYAYPSGYEMYNKHNCYPYMTSAMQLSLMTRCTEHNKRYNGNYQIKIKIENDIKGHKFEQNHILTAYIAENKSNALKLIIYVLTCVYEELREGNTLYPYKAILVLPIMYNTNKQGKKTVIDIQNLLDKNRKKIVDKIKLYNHNKNYLQNGNNPFF